MNTEITEGRKDTEWSPCGQKWMSWNSGTRTGDRGKSAANYGRDGDPAAKGSPEARRLTTAFAQIWYCEYAGVSSST